MLKKVANLILLIFLSTAVVPVVAMNTGESSVRPREKLVIYFGFEEAPKSFLGDIDFLEFSWGGTYNDYSGSTFVRLFDGDTLLAQLDFSQGFFTDNLVDSPVINVLTDMETIREGTINGRLEFIPTFINPIDSSQISLSWTLLVGTFAPGGGFFPGSPTPNVSSFTITPVPVPAAIFLLVPGLFALFTSIRSA